ncbi:succinate dehydrogenase iron-sulfur subunit [Armatimonas rosea]|uniref:succinate dehydrogenase n=1 Tax=Armatimonas rosea TaxID=685828 RepID=A0A7W9STS6_ARMRO|nr:succinate dehydrogenase iron-sulfur subunit [Armatimonas rosea]MBB6052074.1 succinate dehydrogenase / fumarate reductase iron-sulfur subunit [Armatimonas rosea]
MSEVTIQVTVLRQKDPDSAPYEEVFDVPYKPRMNVISVLMEIQAHPVNTKGERVAPVAWDQACLEEVCGSCTVRVNGKVKQACSALIDTVAPLTGNIRRLHLAPMSKFPTVRDLVVDRSRMFENLKKVQAWIPIDGTYDLGPGQRMSQKDQQLAYHFSQCMTCGCCVEACPQVSEKSNFIGPAAIGQVRLFNSHPTGKLNADDRLEAVSGDDGIASCGNAQNCVQVCPKEIPLTRAIAEINRDTTIYRIKKWLGK